MDSKMKKYRILLVVFFGMFLLHGAERFPERGFYLGTNLLVDASVPKIKAVAERAEKAGYNTVYLQDWKFGRPWHFGERYKKRLQEVVNILRQHKLRVIVEVCHVGDPCCMLDDMPEEAEALPSLNSEFRIVNGVFTPENILPNGSFDQGLKGWRLDKGAKIEIDEKAGKSLHFTIASPQDAPKGMSRAWMELKVNPYCQYTLTFKLKTRDVKGPGSSFGLNAAFVADAEENLHGMRNISRRNIDVAKPVKSTQDFTEYQVTFNSLEYSRLKLVAGSWFTRGGEFWFDDFSLKPTSFLNVLHRKTTPVKVTSYDGKKVYEEGKDFTRIVDPACGNYRWQGNFDDTHTPPVVKILPGSAIKEGDVVKASYYHPAFTLRGVCICPNSSKLKPHVEKQIRYFQETVSPDGFLLNIDEQRSYGYDPECVKAGISSGHALNKIAVFAYGKIKEIAPGAKIYMWNDMFDPYGNCYLDRYYYLVRGRGTLYNSWIGLPKDIIILRWTTKNSVEFVKKSMDHFASLGMKYIQFPGYFDTMTFNPKSRQFMEMTVDDPACIGVGFGQWSGINHFGKTTHLEDFLKMVEEVSARKKSLQ